jgi:hypothetical protein
LHQSFFNLKQQGKSIMLSKQLLQSGTLAALGVLVVGAGQGAMAANVNATLTADNFYGLFYGNESGSVLNFVGRNETGGSGDPGQYNWSEAETWNFNVGSDDYLYVVTWDDGAVAESWIGEFEIGGNTVLTGADDWEYIVGGANPFLEDASTNLMPGNAELAGLIGDATWLDTISIGDNGVSPWGTIAGIDNEADWLQTASHTANSYTIFRTKVPAETVAAVPEPGSLIGLLAIGAVSSGAVMKRQRQA